jgi:hypothetical protein
MPKETNVAPIEEVMPEEIEESPEAVLADEDGAPIAEEATA